MLNNSYYGNFRQQKFTDVYPDVDTFVTDYNTIGIKPTLNKADSISTLYYLLYSRYGNSVIASSDTNRFRYNLFAIVFSYGPTWEKRLDIQDKLRNLPESELLTGATQIYNHAYNPGTAPTTQALDELPAINEQNTSKSKRSKLDGYALLSSLLETDVTEEFIGKFKKLFLVVVQPELPLWYTTEIQNDDTKGE